MKCKNYLFSVLFAFLGVFFGSFIINQNNTYAVDDITGVINGSTSTGGNFRFCYELTSTKCSDYKYLILTSNFGASDLSDFLGSRGSMNLRLWFTLANPSGSGGGAGNYFDINFWYTSEHIIELSSYTYEVNYQSQYISSYFPNWEISYTLTNSLGGSTPSGSLEITENGTYDVTDYAEAVVNVPETECSPSTGGDYHEDLVAINNSIMICAATCLVIYFFYCIYRMIIKNSGVK